MQFDWNNQYPTIRMPVMGRNIVSTSHPYAAQAGLKVLQAGGNAIDAAIAAAAALIVVEPVSNGLGSDCFAIVWDGNKLHGLNASGVAPQAWSPQFYEKKYGTDGNGIANRPKRGWDVVTIPGAIAGWDALLQRFGSKPLGDLLEPAIEIAEKGYALPPILAHKWAAGVDELKDQPGFANTFMPDGRAPSTGEQFKFLGAAKTLRQLAKNGLKDFYTGEIASAIVAYSQEHGGSMTHEDLQSYQPEWVGTISQSVLGRDGKTYHVHEIPPNGQGIGALIALGILENFDLASLPVDSVASQHLQIEAMKLAFADVYQYVADARSMEVTPAQMLDPHYLAARAKLIDLKKIYPFFTWNAPIGGNSLSLSC